MADTPTPRVIERLEQWEEIERQEERATAANAELFAEAIRGWLLSKHIPFSEIDAWADEVLAIAVDHPPWRTV